jgi:CCR4-NOT transcriptional regulation complex NOT5 subunit
MPQIYEQMTSESSAKVPVPLNLVDDHLFPSVPMFNRIENFNKFDVETLFFAFYY